VSDETFSAVLGRRQRWIAGLIGIGLGFGVPFVLSVVLIATSGDLLFVILPLPFLCGLWVLQGLAPSGYTLREDGLVLERRWLSRMLPYAVILSVDRRPRRAGGLGAVGFNGLFGAHGVRWNPRTGRHYLFIANTDGLVWLTTQRGLVALSPERPEEFTARLGRRLAAGGPAPSR